MTTSAGTDRRCSDSQTYEIRLQGNLSSRWADVLDGVALTFEGDGTTRLVAVVADQSALHGLLNRIRDLGIPIISIKLLPTNSEEETP